MFDFAWSEIAVIGVVALIAIGPKDMPVAIRAVTGALKKARRMAAEFQTHVDEMVREANLDEVRKEFKDIRNFNFKGEVEKAVDPDGSLRSTFSTPPLKPTSTIVTPPPSPSPSEPVVVGAHEAAVLDRPAEADPLPPVGPAYHPPPPEGAPGDEAEAAASSDGPPAFVPPGAVSVPEPPPAFLPPGVTRHAASPARF